MFFIFLVYIYFLRMLAAVHLPLLRNQTQTVFEQERVLTFVLYLQQAWCKCATLENTRETSRV